MNIHFPKFTSSDEELNKTYNYRCELYQRHVKEIPSGGHVVTEFLPDVPWGGIYNTINCAASHHIRDGRWMHENYLIDEYARFWCTDGNARQYSFPIVDSVLRQADVKGDYSVADELYPKLAEIHAAWDDHRTENILYRQTCNYDGMEYSISGDGLRPTMNSYQYADKRALSVLAERAGDMAKAKAYRDDAEAVKNEINRLLWNEQTKMYGVISEEGEVQNVREQIGYIPWIYGIPTEGRDECFKFLFDESCFMSPYGLRTADASHPRYQEQFKHECLWNGPIWPFAVAQTLTAIIEYLNNTPNPVISNADFVHQLLVYSKMHRDTDGSAYLDENMDPETGVWIAREILRGWNRYDKERGRHYNHSSFIDLVMTGICGIRPSSDDTLVIHPLGLSLDNFSVDEIHYHGRVIAIDWDKTSGIKVKVDGECVAAREPCDDMTITIKL